MGDRMKEKENQTIDCNVHNCKHCDCKCNKCELKEIKVCNCKSLKEKEATMCNNYEKCED